MTDVVLIDLQSLQELCLHHLQSCMVVLLVLSLLNAPGVGSLELGESYELQDRSSRVVVWCH